MSARYVSSKFQSFGLDSSACPVCGDYGARHKIVMKILSMLRSQGNFRFTSVKQFWQLFESDLCYSCRSELDSLSDRIHQAKELLEEAAQLDPGNKTIKDNLAAVKRIT
ncbi:hypothetical protein HUU05_08500 [candidate division KSB1 bacterium]|nr:hypothetical protein [candidate division KSB1 bacterium]